MKAVIQVLAIFSFNNNDCKLDGDAVRKVTFNIKTENLIGMPERQIFDTEAMNILEV